MTASQALCNARYRLVPTDTNYIVTELMVCDRPKFNPHHYGLLGDAPRRRRGDDDGGDVGGVGDDVLERSKRRARRAVRDIMDCNDFDYFMTFTLDREKIDRTDYAAFVRAVNTYMKNRVQRYGWRYLAVPEYHHDGAALHLHAVVSGDRYNLVDSGAVIRPDGGKPVKLTTALRQGYRREDLRTVYNVTDWTLGYSTAIRTYGNRDALRRYVGKYITKSETKIGGRWYFSGGELERPLYICTNLDFSAVAGDVAFQNDGGSFKIQYLDRKTDKTDFDREGIL